MNHEWVWGASVKSLPLGDYSGRNQMDSNVGGPCKLTCPPQRVTRRLAGKGAS